MDDDNLTLLDNQKHTFNKDGQSTYLAVLSTNSEYLLVIITLFIAGTALLGSTYMIYIVVGARKKCGVRMIFYLSVLVGNACQAAFTMPIAIYFILKYRIPLTHDPDVTHFSEGTSLVYLLFCNISGFVYNITRLTTLWFVCAISLDRFLFVCLPFTARHVTRRKYYIASMIIWSFSFGVSVSPYMFGKLYRHYERDIMVCSFLLQDIIPASLTNADNTVDYSVLVGYYFSLIVIPICLPLILILVMTAAVCVELWRIHVKKAVPSVMKENISSLRRFSRCIRNDTEVRLTLVMICTSVSYTVCYALWFLSLFMNIGILLKFVSPNWYYSSEDHPEPISLVMVQLFKICEMTGFIDTAFEPAILYSVLIKPSRKDSASTMITTPR